MQAPQDTHAAGHSPDEESTTPRSQRSLAALRCPEVALGEGPEALPVEKHDDSNIQRLDGEGDPPCPVKTPALSVAKTLTTTRTPSPTDSEKNNNGGATAPVDLERNVAPPERPPWRIRYRLQGARLWICIVLIVGCVLIVIVLPTAIVEGNKAAQRKKAPAKPVSPPQQPQPYGVIDHTGVVALDMGNDTDTILLYRQASDGSVRKSTYLNGIWTGGEASDIIVAPNARAGTPLMAVSFVKNQELIWRVFYVDTAGYLQESINSNKTSGGWTTGLLGAGKHKVSASQNVGVTACHNDRWYGAPYNSTAGGLRLYYGAAGANGSNDSFVQELAWADGNGAWDVGSKFEDTNGDGGVECTVGHFGQPPSFTNLWLLNTKGELEQRWMDFNRTANTSTHITGSWVRGITYPGLKQNTAISAITTATQKLINVQIPDNRIRQLITTGNAETSKFERSLDVVGPPGIAGTRIGSVILKTALGGDEIHVFYQTNSTTVIDFTRTLDGVSWAASEVVMPK